jgi:hypothetical protein
MSTRLEVQSAIEQLPESEIRDLAKWLQEYLEHKWDRQIATDFAAGKLDRLVTKAESDISFQRSPSDPEFSRQMEVAKTVMNEDRTLLRKLAQ